MRIDAVNGSLEPQEPVAADAERARLEAVIDDARARARRALALNSLQHVMVDMLLETQRELGALRAAAEQEAAEILGEAEQQALAILRDARRDAGLTNEPTTHDAACFHPTPSSLPPIGASMMNEVQDDRYLSYLRGALADERPLGPRFD
jgi:hypothetical protein